MAAGESKREGRVVAVVRVARGGTRRARGEYRDGTPSWLGVLPSGLLLSCPRGFFDRFGWDDQTPAWRSISRGGEARCDQIFSRAPRVSPLVPSVGTSELSLFRSRARATRRRASWSSPPGRPRRFCASTWRPDVTSGLVFIPGSSPSPRPSPECSPRASPPRSRPGADPPRPVRRPLPDVHLPRLPSRRRGRGERRALRHGTQIHDGQPRVVPGRRARAPFRRGRVRGGARERLGQAGRTHETHGHGHLPPERAGKLRAKGDGTPPRRRETRGWLRASRLRAPRRRRRRVVRDVSDVVAEDAREDDPRRAGGRSADANETTASMDANETTASMDANETTASMDANETTASMDANETTASMDANETTASSAGSSTTTRATVRSPSRDVSGSGSSAGSGSSPGSETPPGSGSPSGARAKTNESASTSDPAGGAPDASEETARAIVSAAESVSTSTAGRRARTRRLTRRRRRRKRFDARWNRYARENARRARRSSVTPRRFARRRRRRRLGRRRARAEADAAGRLASERAREMSDDAERVARRATEAIARARAEVEAAERARIATVVVPAPASLAPVRLSRAEDDAREGEENREEQTPSTSAGPGPGPGSDSGPGSGRPSTPRPRAVSPRGGSPRRPPLAPPTRARVSVEDSAMSRRTTPRQPPSPSRKRPSTRDDHDEELSAAATNRAVMTIEIEQARRFGEVFARAERVFASWSR